MTAGATETAERHAVAAGIVVAALALAATFVISNSRRVSDSARLFFL